MIRIVTVLISILLTILGYILLIPESIIFKILLIICLFIWSFLLQTILFFLIAFICSLFVSSKKEYNHYNKTYRKIFYLYTKYILSFFGVKIISKGLENIPKDTPFVLYFNHKSNLDTFVIDVCFKDYPLVFVGKKSLFKIPFFGKIITKLGYISLDRENLRSELKSILKGVNYINDKECSVGISPEGTRNFTKRVLLDFKSGCFNLSTKTNTPMVIVVLRGTEKVKSNLLFKRHKVYLDVVKVINYDEYKGLKTNEISEMVEGIMYGSLTDKKVSKEIKVDA